MLRQYQAGGIAVRSVTSYSVLRQYQAGEIAVRSVTSYILFPAGGDDNMANLRNFEVG
jgi:hypothetical protein